MNDHEAFEAELRRLKPAAPPANLVARLATIAPPTRQRNALRDRQTSVVDAWWQMLRWLAPATAAVGLLIAATIWWPAKPGPEQNSTASAATAASAPKPDAVQLDRKLVAAYDALAELPGGEPVRFRCQEWMDAIVLRDAKSGLLIEQQTPRFEIVAARLDTF